LKKKVLILPLLDALSPECGGGDEPKVAGILPLLDALSPHYGGSRRGAYATGNIK